MCMLALLVAGSAACSPSDAIGTGSGGTEAEPGLSDKDGKETDGSGTSDSRPPFTGYGGYNTGCTKVDILFVIDNSGSMAEEQENLARNFPQFIRQVEDYVTTTNEQLDYRVGVTSTSRANLSFDHSTTVKQGGAECRTTADCQRNNVVCECPRLNFAECSDACPGRCFCEPPGFTMPMQERCDGEDGALVAPSGYGQPWIDGPGAHVAGAFTEAATLGVTGCSMEMPLYAAEHALSTEFGSAPGGPNEGFLRPNALLMLIIVTDEDDCSTDVERLDYRTVIDTAHPFAVPPAGDFACTDEEGNDTGEPYWPISHYLRFFDDLMGGSNRWAAAVIAGQESCQSAYGSAFTAHRLRRFVEGVGDNGVFSDICQADLAQALGEALDTLTVACDDFGLI
jgi:hypothetical protein